MRRKLAIDESWDDPHDSPCWLIEWPANKQYPLRYYAAGEPYVIDPNDATRFVRKKDAEAFIRAECMAQGGATAREHIFGLSLPRNAEA